jgi:hypothetical protein
LAFLIIFHPPLRINEDDWMICAASPLNGVDFFVIVLLDLSTHIHNALAQIHVHTYMYTLTHTHVYTCSDCSRSRLSKEDSMMALANPVDRMEWIVSRHSTVVMLCLVLFNPALSYAIMSCPVQSFPIPSYPLLSFCKLRAFQKTYFP